MRVLIVDDNEVLTGLIKEILEIEGDYHVKTAGNGEEGCKAFVNFKPDVILTDIEMPIKNGLQMIKEIRAHHPGIKAIYMSASPDRYRKLLEDEKLQYKSAFLNKPLYLSEMIALFQEYQKATQPGSIEGGVL